MSILDSTIRVNKHQVQLFFTKPTSNDAFPILILPNGYGVLAYTKTLLNSLLRHDYSPYSINMEGQGDNKGTLSLETAVENLTISINHIYGLYERKIPIIVHCSAIYYLLNLKQSGIWDLIDQVILYGYLERPSMHVERFRKMALKYGVTFDVSALNIPDYTPTDLKRIKAPLSIIHPQTKMNLVRCAISNIQDVVDHGLVKHLATPGMGYEILDSPQEDLVNYITDEYFMPLLRN